jgi:hypothetical protein
LIESTKDVCSSWGLENEGTAASRTIFLIELQNCRFDVSEKKLNNGRLKRLIKNFTK